MEKQTAEEVKQAGVGGDCRTALTAQRLLSDLDNRGQPLDSINVRLVGGRERRDFAS